MNSWAAGRFIALLLSFAAASFAADLQVRVSSPSPAGLPREILGELQPALGATNFTVRTSRGSSPSQSWTNADGTTTLLWQGADNGTYRIAGGSTSGKHVGEQPLARVEAGVVRIQNTAYSTAHDPANAGGFPAEVLMTGAQKPVQLKWADRLYEKEIGELSLAANPKPDVTLIANGPLAAVVEVSGGYYRKVKDQAVQHESQPKARYRFTYYRNSPLVRVQAVVTQESSFEWKELHVLELRTTDPKRWAGGGADAEGEINHITNSKTFSRWAGMFFDGGVVAVMNPSAFTDGAQQARIYDGKGLNYVMGPWLTQFAGPRVEVQRWLCFASPQSDRQSLDAISRELVDSVPLAAESPELERRAKQLREQVQESLPGLGNRTARAQQLWKIAHALADLHMLRNVKNAQAILTHPAPKRILPREVPPEAEILSLGNGRDAIVTDQLLLSIDSKGRLDSLFQTQTETELVVSPCSMFRFVARNPVGVEASVTANDAERVTAVFLKDELRLRYTGHVFGLNAVTVELTLRPHGPSVFWSAKATCEGEGAACWRIDFPVLDGLGRLEGSDAGDALLVPDGWGRLLPAPTTTKFSGRYPGGGATMQFIGCTRGSDTTLGLIARDGRCFTKDFVASSSGGSRSFALEVRHYPEDMGKTMRCEMPYEVEMAALSGDWFALAQQYRSWAIRQVWCEKGKNRRRNDTPDWFRKLVWWHHEGTRDGAKLTDAMDHLRKAVPYPMAFHWYNWHSIPFDNFYPDYFPANDYVPSVRAKLREWNIRAMPYINGHLWDTASKSYTEEGAVRWAMKKPDGSIYIEHWNKHDHSLACPFTDAWRDKMVAVTDRLFRELGMDAVYLDQIGATSAQLCYDPHHGHPLGGGDYYVAGYWKLLQAVRENARHISPNTALTTEDTAEPYIRYLDGTLMCNRALPDSIAFFPAVYHDYVAQFGLYIYEPEIKAGTAFRSKEAMLFQFGGQLGWNGTNWKETPEHQAKFQWLAKLASFRQLGLSWLAYGDMLHPPRVTLQDGSPVPQIAERWTRYKSEVDTMQPAVTTSAWQASDGRVAMFVINVSDQPQRVLVQVPEEAKKKRFSEWQPGGKEQDAPELTDGKFTLELPPQSVRMIVGI